MMNEMLGDWEPNPELSDEENKKSLDERVKQVEKYIDDKLERSNL